MKLMLREQHLSNMFAHDWIERGLPKQDGSGGVAPKSANSLAAHCWQHSPSPSRPRRSMAFFIRRRSFVRIIFVAAFVVLIRLLLVSSSTASSVSSLYSPNSQEIRKQNVLDLVARSDKPLDARKYKFLQARMGRDERKDLFHDVIRSGVLDFWERFQKP